jgi:hypothetical protein
MKAGSDFFIQLANAGVRADRELCTATYYHALKQSPFFSENAMLNLVLALFSTLGASFGGEVPKEWVTVYRAFQDAAASQEKDWMKYYKILGPRPVGNSTGSRIQFAPIFKGPTMTWGVPNSIPGAPSFPSQFPAYGSFQSFQGTPLPPGISPWFRGAR